MDINEILKGWGIKVPKDKWFAEYFCENEIERKKTFVIDKFPFVTGPKEIDKYNQFEIIYQQVFHKKADKKDFLKIELKYREVMNKLWLYNKTFLEVSLPEKLYAKYDQIVDEEYKKYLPLLKDKNLGNELIEITQKGELEFWLQLAVRDSAYVSFYLQEYEIIIVPYNCFLVYFHDMKFFPIIEKIAASEGLFIRE